jgi:Cdc6-like AAA superfamily ATPase
MKHTKATVDKLYLDSRQRKIIQWLSPSDPSTNYNKALQQRQEGTGLWFLKGDAFAAWKSQRHSFMWLYGIPGCGKTILSTSIIEHLRSFPDLTLLYFYFDFNDVKKQSLEGVVKALISQLYYTCRDAQKPLDALYSSSNEGSNQPSCESLCKVFLQMIEQAKDVSIVLDALDECSTRKGRPTEGLLSWIRDLLNSERISVHLLVTSRPEQDIQSGLNDLVNEESKIDIQSNLVTDDISAYIRARVRHGEGLKRWQNHPDVQKKIEEKLIQGANGM